MKGLARKLPPTLASFTSQSENSPDSIEEGQARSVIPLGDTPTIVNASTHVGSDGPNKRMGEVLFPDHSKKHIHESLQEIHATCQRAEVKHAASVDSVADLIYSMEVEGGCLWKVKEEISQLKNDNMRSHTLLEAQLSQVQETQDRILSLLQEVRGQKEDHLTILQHIVSDLRSTTNKLLAISKVYNIGISESRATTNKLHAILKCHFEKPSASK